VERLESKCDHWCERDHVEYFLIASIIDMKLKMTWAAYVAAVYCAARLQ